LDGKFLMHYAIADLFVPDLYFAYTNNIFYYMLKIETYFTVIMH